MSYPVYFGLMIALWSLQIYSAKKLPFECQYIFVMASFFIGFVLVVTHGH